MATAVAGSFKSGEVSSGQPGTESARSFTQSFREFRAEANYLVVVAIATAMMGALMFGADQGNYGLVQGFPTFLDTWCKPNYPDYAKTCDKQGRCGCTPEADEDFAKENPTPAGWTSFLSWGGSLITLGAAAGSLLCGPFISTACGRRVCISFGGLSCFIGCLLASYLSGNKVWVYYIGRFVTGFGAGITCFSLPIYNAEVATPAIRGTMGSLFQFMVVIGGVLACIVLAKIEDWRFGMLLPGICGAIVGVAIWLCPESPAWLMEKRGYESGKEALKKIRRGDVAFEADQMLADANEAKKAGQIGQQLTGVNAFLSYTTKLFESAGISAEEINHLPGYAIYFNFAMLGGCVLGLALIDSKYGGRKLQLLIASAFMGPPLIIAAVSKLSNWPAVVPIIMVFLYGPAFQLAWGLVPWLYPAEIFLMSEKDRAVSLSTFLNFCINFAVTFITPALMNWSPAGTFLVFGGLNVTNFFFVLACVKETGGFTTEENVARYDGKGNGSRAPMIALTRSY